jgi:hypothetical protein
MMIEHAHAASLIPHLAMMCSQHPHCLKVPRVTHPARPAWAQFCFNGDHSRIEMRQEVDTLPWEPNSTISDVLKPLGAGFSGATTSLAPAVRALAAGAVAHSVERRLCYDALFLRTRQGRPRACSFSLDMPVPVSLSFGCEGRASLVGGTVSF